MQHLFDNDVIEIEKSLPDYKVMFADKTLFYYQIEAVSQTISAFQHNATARVLVKLFTGAGKTVVTGAIINDATIRAILLKGKTRKTLRVVFKSHRNRLIVQADRLFSKEDGFAVVDDETKWLNTIPSKAKVEILYQTLGQKLDRDVEIDLIIFEECHHEGCKTAQDFLELAGKFPFLGLTATDERADNLLIKFDKIIEPITRQEGVEQGFICETDIKSIIDTTGNLDKTEILKDIIDNYGHQMGQVLIFTRTIKEAVNVAIHLRRKGYTAVGIEPTHSDHDVNMILDNFSAGDLKFVVNANKLGEGIDCAGVTDVIIGKQIGSYPLMNQLIGRAARVDVPQCRVWELINPLSGYNLDSTIIVGKPKSHELIYKKNGEWLVIPFDSFG